MNILKSYNLWALAICSSALFYLLSNIDINFWINCNNLFGHKDICSEYNSHDETILMVAIINVVTPYLIAEKEWKNTSFSRIKNKFRQQLYFLLYYLFLALAGLLVTLILYLLLI